MTNETNTSARRGIRTLQAVNAAGEPDTAEFFRLIDETHPYWPSHQLAYDFIRRLNGRRTEHVGTYSYSHPEHGSGELVLEGWPSDAVARIEDALRVGELSRRVGVSEPGGRSPDRRLYLTTPGPFRNPILMTVLATVLLAVFVTLFVSVGWGPMQMNDPSDPMVGVMLGIIATTAALSGFLVVWHARKIGWWLAVRREARQSGEPIPIDLRTWE